MQSQEVLCAMELATYAYNDRPPEPVLALQQCCSVENGVQFFTRREQDTLRIVFCGSNSRQDWRTNLTFFKKQIPYGNTRSKIRVHSGFLAAYKHEAVRDELLTLAKDAQRICVCGHSYGAALAVLCALDIQYNYPEKDIEAYLFGCPRVGNRAFGISYDKRVIKTVRVENGGDIVTHMPPAIFGFRHVGARFHVGRERTPLHFSAHDHRQMSYYQGLLNRLLP